MKEELSDLSTVKERATDVVTEQQPNQKLKQEIADFQKRARAGELPPALKHLNLESFDQDGNGLDKFEEQNYQAALDAAIEQIVKLDSVEAFTKEHAQAQEKSWFSFDKKVADLINIQSYFGDGEGNALGEKALNKLNFSSAELNEMAERKFKLTSKKSWQELGILISKEIGDGAEMVLRFFGNIPAGVMVLPRYLKYRVENNSADPKTATKAEIRLKHLIEDNPSLMLPQLLGEQGVELIKELGRMTTTGKQGDIAIVLTSIAGIISGGAGATKFMAKMGKMEKLVAKAGKVQKVAETIDSTTVAGADRLPGAVLKKGKELLDGKETENEPTSEKAKQQQEQIALEQKIAQDIDRNEDIATAIIEQRRAEKMEREALENIKEAKERQEQKGVESEQKKDKKLSEESTTEQPATTAIEKKSFWEKARDKRNFSKIKKMGFEDPERAFEVYRYIEDLGRRNKQTEINPEKFREAIAALQKHNNLDEIFKKGESIFEDFFDGIRLFNQEGYKEFSNLLKDGDCFKKMEFLEEYKKKSGKELRGSVSDWEIKFAEEYSLDDLSRANILSKASGFADNPIGGFLPFTKNEAEYKFLLKILENGYAKEILKLNSHNLTQLESLFKQIADENISFEYLDKLSSGYVAKNEFLDLSRFSEFSEKNEEKLRSLMDKISILGEFLQDERAEKFVQDFSLLLGSKRFSLDELMILKNIYGNHQEHALAFFESFQKMGVLDKNGPDLQKFSNILDIRKKEFEAKKGGDGLLLDREAEKQFFLPMDEEFQRQLVEFFEKNKIDLEKEGGVALLGMLEGYQKGKSLDESWKDVMENKKKLEYFNRLNDNNKRRDILGAIEGSPYKKNYLRYIFMENNNQKFQDFLLDTIKLEIEYGYLDSAETIRSSNFLSDETKKQLKQNPEIQGALFEGIKSKIEEGDLDSAERIRNNEKFPLSDETKKQLKQNPEIQGALFEGIKSKIKEGDLDSAERIRNSDFLSSKTKEQLKQDSEIQEALSKAIKLRIERGYLDSAERIRNSNFLSDETKEQLKQNPKIQQALFEAIKSEIKRGNLGSAETIINNKAFPLSDETKEQLKQNPEIQQALFEGIKSRIEGRDLDSAETIRNSDFLSDETKKQLEGLEFQEFLFNIIKLRIERGNLGSAGRIGNSDFLSDETKEQLKQNPKIQQALFEGIKSKIEGRDLYDVEIIGNSDFLSDETKEQLKQNPKIQQALFEGIKSKIEEGSIYSAETIRNSDFLSDETKEQLKQNPKIQQALFEAIKSEIKRGNLDSAEIIINNEKFPLLDETKKQLEGLEFQKFLFNIIESEIERGYLDSAERIKNNKAFPLSDETKEQLKQNPKIQQALFEAIKSEIKRGNLDSAETIGNSDFLSNETKKQLKQDSEIQEALFKAVESRIERGYFDGVKTIGNSNFLSDETKEQLKQNPEIQWALSKAIKSRIERGYFDGVKTIRNSDFLSDETIAKFKTSEFLLDIVKHNVENGNIRNIARIIADKNFHLNRESVKKLYLPEVAKLFPQKISFEDLLNIYDFDENGRAKLKKEYEQAVKIFSRNMEGRVRSGLAREIMEKRAKLRKMKEENGASSSVEMVSLKNDLENILREYYAEQGALWFDFKNNPDRLVSEQSRNKNIFFLHQMPILPGDRSYSRLGSNVPFDVLANLNVALEPTLSTSFKEFNLGGGYRIANQKDGAGGLLFGNGKIALADAGDSYTISDGLDAKFRHRFGDGVSVDDNIEQRMNDILQKERVKNRWGHNEIIIHRPQVCGVFLYADEFETAIDSERINIAQKAANEIGVPLFRINEDGRIRKMGENYDLKLEEVLANTLNLSKEEKEKIVQEKLINSGQFTRDYIESFKKRKNQFERESDRRIRELEEVVSDEEYSPEKLIYALKNNFEEQYATKDMTWEGYSLEEHTKMVLNQFEKYFKDFDSPLVSKSNLRLFLALHDIGKPEAIKLGNKALQHEKTAPIINNVFDVLKLPKKEKDILVAISKDDYIGKYLRDKISLEKVADSVKNIAEKQGVSEKDLLYLMEVYHKSDAGSYTENAGGKRSLDKYFEFDERNGKMKYSDKYQAKMDELRTVLGIGN